MTELFVIVWMINYTREDEHAHSGLSVRTGALSWNRTQGWLAGHPVHNFRVEKVCGRETMWFEFITAFAFGGARTWLCSPEAGAPKEAHAMNRNFLALNWVFTTGRGPNVGSYR